MTITETGSPGGGLTDDMSHTARLAIFCIPETGNDLIDGAAVHASRRGFAAGIGTDPAVRKETS